MVSQSPTQIDLEWQAPANGGMPILSYTLVWDGLNPGSETFTEISTFDAQTLTYTNLMVTPGVTYVHKVLATNIVGDSLLSEPVTIMAAQKPSKPDTPVEVQQ
jgi:hypothetical protein